MFSRGLIRIRKWLNTNTIIKHNVPNNDLVIKKILFPSSKVCGNKTEKHANLVALSDIAQLVDASLIEEDF